MRPRTTHHHCRTPVHSRAAGGGRASVAPRASACIHARNGRLCRRCREQHPSSEHRPRRAGPGQAGRSQPASPRRRPVAAAQVWRTLEETRSPRNSLVELRFLVEAADVMTLHSPSERASHSLSSVRASGLPQCPARDGMGSAQQRLQIVCPPQNPDGAAHAATFHLRAANIHATTPAHAMHLHM